MRQLSRRRRIRCNMNGNCSRCAAPARRRRSHHRSWSARCGNGRGMAG
jgi:hypothetical protein